MQTPRLPFDITMGGMKHEALRTRIGLVSICLALGGAKVGGPLSRAERLLTRAASTRRVDERTLDEITGAVEHGQDPLGDILCGMRTVEERRRRGTFYTNPAIVSAMLASVIKHDPKMIIDADCGSGRFAVTAKRLGFSGQVLAIDNDPLSTLVTRAHLAALRTTARVINADFLRFELPRRAGRCAFVGNPPYVRHHELAPATKRWAQTVARQLGLRVSGLSGLHVLFVLAAAQKGRPEDLGCFITAAEWLDVGYGSALRELFAGKLGCARLDVVDPTVATFEDAMSTALIVSWQGGYSGPITARRVNKRDDLSDLSGGRVVPRSMLNSTQRWSELVRTSNGSSANGLVRLGSLARVHRGVATGANRFFVLRADEAKLLGLQRHVQPCVVRATQVLSAGGVIRAGDISHVLLNPERKGDLDPNLRRYLRKGELEGVPAQYLCSHRDPWWHVGGSLPPPIIATYMARQPPAFALNPDRCQIVNVLHGIHFLEQVDDETAAALVSWLNQYRETLDGGRIYHGGLWKFEPRELEAILVPPLDELKHWTTL